jgi:RNA polymerase sigma-70 factor, ECF subfamily
MGSVYARLKPMTRPVDASSGGAPIQDIETAFRTYASYVATIAYRIIGSRDDLEDLVQDVFLGAHRHLGQLRNPDALKAWLATSTVRLARRRLRVRRLKRLLMVGDVVEEAPDPAASPETRAQVKAIFRALDRLPDRLRVVWCLRYLEGLSLEEVATASGCSLAAVKRRLTKAKLFMDEVLQHD